MDLNDSETWRWIWLVAVLALALGEIVVPGTFFMISFALGAAVASVVAFLGGAIPVQWVCFVAGSGVALALLIPVGRRLNRPTGAPGVGATRWEGRVGVVLGPIPDGPHATGLVRVEREEWRAESADGRPIEAGVTVRVLRVDGTRLIVDPVDGVPTGEPPGPR